MLELMHHFVGERVNEQALSVNAGVYVDERGALIVVVVVAPYRHVKYVVARPESQANGC